MKTCVQNLLATVLVAVLATVATTAAHAQVAGKAGQVGQQAAAQGPLVSPRPGSVVKAQYGYWKHECTKPPGAKNELCAITQDVTDERNNDIGVSVHVQVLPGGQRILRVIAPLGVLLTHNLAIKIDGDYLGEAPFSRCYVLGCQAQIEIDEKLSGRLATGKTVLLVIHRTQEEGIGIPISLQGFSQAIAALGGKTR